MNEEGEAEASLFGCSFLELAQGYSLCIKALLKGAYNVNIKTSNKKYTKKPQKNARFSWSSAFAMIKYKRN